VYQEIWKEFLERLRTLKEPLAHGTTSEHLRSIVERGLGAVMPDNAYARTISASNVADPSYFPEPLAFAMASAERLQLLSEELTGRDAIHRMAARSGRSSESLHRQFAHYFRRRRPTGFPVVLVYDGHKHPYEKNVNPYYASEVLFPKPPRDMRPAFVLVPRADQDRVQRMLRELPNARDTKIFPIEILMLDAN
jgi:hypothetical protein